MTYNILNLYAGLGGNRKHWYGNVTAVESDPDIAKVYKKLYPRDTVLVEDAHAFLEKYSNNFDFIWSSPPCQSHSRMAIATRHTNNKYPDLKLYEEILFLKYFYGGKWVVENVKGFYSPLITPTKEVGRHVFWSNFEITAEDQKTPPDFINLGDMAGRKKVMDWLGIHTDEVLYYKGNHNPCQVLNNCVHPKLGLQVFESSFV